MSRKQQPLEPDELFGSLDPDTRISGDISEEHSAQSAVSRSGYDSEHSRGNMLQASDQQLANGDYTNEGPLEPAFSQDEGSFDLTFAGLRSNLERSEPIELTNSGTTDSYGEESPPAPLSRFYDEDVVEVTDPTRQLADTRESDRANPDLDGSDNSDSYRKNEIEIGSEGFSLPLSIEEAQERINDPSVFTDEIVTRIEPIGGLALVNPIDLETGDAASEPQGLELETYQDPPPEPPPVPLLTISEDALVTISNGEAERFQREITREALERLHDQTERFDDPNLQTPTTALGETHAEEPAVAVIETRNTRTREVLLDANEFTLAQQQIIELGYVNIPGKALVLEAVAITRQLPDIQLHRRRRRRA